jgi:hypothetical protein
MATKKEKAFFSYNNKLRYQIPMSHLRVNYNSNNKKMTNIFRERILHYINLSHRGINSLIVVIFSYMAG